MTAHSFECPDCEGLGVIVAELWPGLGLTSAECLPCNATGWIECDRGGVDCPFKRCECERAWEQQEQSKMEDF